MPEDPRFVWGGGLLPPEPSTPRRRRRRRFRPGRVADSASDGCDACDACDACDGCSGCDLLVLTLLRAVLVPSSAVVPAVPEVMRADSSLPSATRWVLAVLRWYKRVVSARTPNVCRLTPSCSAYAAEAVRRYGVRRGAGLAYWRIRRCRPTTPRGHDPVPD